MDKELESKINSLKSQLNDMTYHVETLNDIVNDLKCTVDKIQNNYASARDLCFLKYRLETVFSDKDLQLTEVYNNSEVGLGKTGPMIHNSPR